MTIRWYPGHMDKALEQMAETVRRIDVIIEVLDARLPSSSSNHLLEGIRRTKPCIKVLNKNDLADPAITKAWVRHFEAQAGVKALPLSARQLADAKKLIKLCQRLVPHRGKPGWPLRVMVFGIPNVGKSTLINTLAGRSLARVGDKPAITTCAQQIDLKNGIILSDTPGVLWPEMDDQVAAKRLAASGAIGSGAFDVVTVALFAAEYMMQRYPQTIRERYKLAELPDNPTTLLDAVGRRLGCLISGGTVDHNRAAEAFLRELRSGKLGRISFEEPCVSATQADEDASPPQLPSAGVPAVDEGEKLL
ncbi:ribosome biogenesis GTPase YlqF [Pelobacter propionicus]|uniref:Ribosome biogenesis GTPase A n=1 Tax=Pelobacter propionicus (strain DSM 2379 / NBRC 103807 / OttBd1) TaxID=338966 RepID=A1AQY4_PELPD|nr:ribosome biogenesis GTPase YlqF [Pelobacter propionicus]ABK99754.1 GTP-binding protein, HSR1-related protein [Pelobacter propionicus DSM 2379]